MIALLVCEVNGFSPLGVENDTTGIAKECKGVDKAEAGSLPQTASTAILDR